MEGTLSIVHPALFDREETKLIICITEFKGGKLSRGNKKLRLSRRNKRDRDDLKLPYDWRAGPIQRFSHDSVSGVSDGLFQVVVFHRPGVEASWSLPPMISNVLQDALDPTIRGYYNVPKRPSPEEGQLVTFRGLVQWDQRHERIIAPIIYHDGGIERVMSVREKTSNKMTEEQLELLTKTVIPGKVYYAGAFCITSYHDLKMTAQGSLKRSHSSIQSVIETKSGNSKRRRITSGRESTDFLFDEPVDVDDKESQVTAISGAGFKEAQLKDVAEAEPAAKAVKADNAKVPVGLWNNRVVQKLKEHWEEERKKEEERKRKEERRNNEESRKEEGKRKVIENLQEEWDSTGKGFLRHLNLAEGTTDREKFDKFLDSFRHVMIKYWKSEVMRDFNAWYKEKGRFHPDAKQVLIDGNKAVKQEQHFSFWEWTKGSSIFFWRWPEDYQDIV